MHSREERLAELLVRWEEVRAGDTKVEVETFCRAQDCTDLIGEFRQLVGVFAPLEMVEHTQNGVAGADDNWNAPNRYRVKEVLGRGGLGVVYRALDIELERDVAIKRLQRIAADDPDARDRFLHEAKLTGRLDHPGVVPVHALESDSENAYYTMRVISGESLREAIERFHSQKDLDVGERNVELRRLLRAFGAACETVAFAHSRGVIHRDLKPHNIMLGGYGETLVIDWGLSKEGDAVEAAVSKPSAGQCDDAYAHTIAGRAMGTWAYMSPEQARGQWQQVGSASDIFSLGATLYHLLAGRAPYVADDIPDNVEAGRFALPSRWNAEVPKPLEAVCHKAMANEPANRYRDARDLARDVERWLADEPVSAFRDPFPVRARRWAKRHRTLVATFLVLLITAVIALSIGLFFVNQEKNRTELARQDTKKALDAVTSAQRRTRQALDATTDAAVERLLARQKRLGPPERAFLSRVLGYYQDFAADASDSPEVQTGAANAFFRSGVIRMRMGDRAGAEADFRAAIDRYQRLTDNSASSQSAEFRLEKTNCQINLAVVLRDLGRSDEAVAIYREFETELPTLVEQLPGPLARQVRRQQALAANGLGNIYEQAGRREEAVAAHRRAAAIHRELISLEPQRTSHVGELSGVLVNIGIELLPLRQFDEADRVLREALDHYRELARREPDEPEHISGQAHTLMTLAMQTGGRLQITQAIELLREATKLLRKLVDEYPADEEFRREHASAVRNLGVFLRNTANKAEAEQCLREAAGALRRLIEDSEDVIEHRAHRGATLFMLGDTIKQRDPKAAARHFDDAADDLLAAREGGAAGKVAPMLLRMLFWNQAELAQKAGDHATLAAAARHLSDFAVNPQQDSIHAAKFLAQAAALAAKANHADSSAKYADIAIQVIRRAMAAGFKDTAKLKGEEFAPLRLRPDFQKVIVDLEK